jgi:hypothetical protein
VLSGYKRKLTPRKIRGKSLIYNKNKRGPKIEACGMPYKVTLDEDKYLLNVNLVQSVCVNETDSVCCDK